MVRMVRLLVVGLLIVVGGQALAMEVLVKGASVYVNGLLVMTFRASSGGNAPETRATLAAGILESEPESAGIDLRPHGDGFELLFGNRRLATIGTSDAALQKTTATALAESWAAQLRLAVAMPEIGFETSEISLPPDGTRIVATIGSRVSSAELGTTNASIAEASAVPGGVKVVARGAGAASIILKYRDRTESMNVVVRPYAGDLPNDLDAEVTGSPAAGSAVRGAISYAVRTHTPRLPQSEVSVAPPEAGALAARQNKTYPVRVRISAPGAFDRVGYVNVAVRNVDIPNVDDDELWYCNDPETVRSSRNLFAATLQRSKSARLLYHHVNGSSVPLYIRIQVINDSDVPAKLLLTPGDASPHKNPVMAGADAADLYMRSWTSGSGEVVTIPPGQTIPISLRQITPSQTASGLCGIRLLEGPDDILVRADSWPPFRLDDRWRSAVASTAPWREVGANPINSFDTAGYERSRHIFPNPYKNATVNYNVGGRHAFLRIGQQPIAQPEYGLNLDGNFGVIYKIAASMSNMTSTATDVEVVFEASAGYSAGLFLVNGSLQRTPLLFARQEARIAKVRLEPGQNRTLSITTLPLSGSSYPATITIRPIVAAGA